MKHIVIKLVWAFRILKARHFIVLTNKASMLFIPESVVKDPKFSDSVSLLSQRSLLVEYREAMTAAIKDFDKEMQRKSKKQTNRKSTKKA